MEDAAFREKPRRRGDRCDQTPQFGQEKRTRGECGQAVVQTSSGRTTLASPRPGRQGQYRQGAAWGETEAPGGPRSKHLLGWLRAGGGFWGFGEPDKGREGNPPPQFRPWRHAGEEDHCGDSQGEFTQGPRLSQAQVGPHCPPRARCRAGSGHRVALAVRGSFVCTGNWPQPHKVDSGRG